MVYTAHWQAVGLGNRDNRGDGSQSGESSIEQAQNDILSTIAKRTPKEHERGECEHADEISEAATFVLRFAINFGLLNS